MYHQLPKIGRQESMFHQGKGAFQPASAGSLGQVRLRSAGSLFAPPPMLPPRQPAYSPEMGQASPIDPGASPVPVQDVPRRPAIRIAWGRLKKADAVQLADVLAEILERMRALDIPAGMVSKIQARMEAFAASGPVTATVELTEPEVRQLDAEILLLEETEAKETSEAATVPWALIAASAAGLGILITLLSD